MSKDITNLNIAESLIENEILDEKTRDPDHIIKHDRNDEPNTRADAKFQTNLKDKYEKEKDDNGINIDTEKGDLGPPGDSKKAEVFNLDKVLMEEVGQFGKYQLITLILAAIPCIFTAWAQGEYVFTTARIPTRCLIPQCDSLNPEYYTPWVLNAIPGTDLTTFENCERFSNSTVNNDEETEQNTCPAIMFDQSSVEDCQTYVYENQDTVVYDYNLACDEWRRSQIGSIRTIGVMVVLPITGFVSDRWGRRVALALNGFNTAWVGLVRYFANSYELFVALEFIEAALGAGAFSACYILVTELVGPKYRVASGAMLSTMFAVGHVLMAAMAWAVQPWRPLTLALYAPQLLMVSYFWILTESVRWLLSKGRFEECETILKKAEKFLNGDHGSENGSLDDHTHGGRTDDVAKKNNREISEKSLLALRAAAVADLQREKPVEPWLPIVVFKSKLLLVRCLVSPIWWITTTFVYYGMNINSVSLSGNRFLNYGFVAAIEIPGFWTAILLLDRIGRKPVLIFFFWLCSACQFGFAFIPDGPYRKEGMKLALYLVGKYAIACVMTSVYVYTAELYPTKYRHSLFNFSSMMGRLGSITAPLTPALALTVWESLPSVLFGSFALLSGALIFITPETLGTKLPDTVEEAELVGVKKKNILP